MTADLPLTEGGGGGKEEADGGPGHQANGEEPLACNGSPGKADGGGWDWTMTLEGSHVRFSDV